MMCETHYGIVLFRSTQGAIRAERALVQAGFVVQLIPTPRRFSSDCGTALRCRWEDVDAVRAALQAAHVDYDSIHSMVVRTVAHTGR
jgi:hypothetical protein